MNLGEARIIFLKVKEALSKSGLPDLDYALNPYMGCWHSCIYCYARLYTWYKEIADNWGRIIAVKENIVEVLRREIKYKPRGIVGVGTITDAYQPVEALYEITQKSLKVLFSAGFHASIQTKNPLIL
ncbi:MAG TPA: radical SAM protein, partial [Desulfurococcaceae archaeon]|nr:radical SAM protein [Desulfurococcaceae archaeon]